MLEQTNCSGKGIPDTHLHTSLLLADAAVENMINQKYFYNRHSFTLVLSRFYVFGTTFSLRLTLNQPTWKEAI